MKFVDLLFNTYIKYIYGLYVYCINISSYHLWCRDYEWFCCHGWFVSLNLHEHIILQPYYLHLPKINVSEFSLLTWLLFLDRILGFILFHFNKCIESSIIHVGRKWYYSFVLYIDHDAQSYHILFYINSIHTIIMWHL